MQSYLCITVHYLQPMCHGRGDQGQPEWPPSPLRLFQSLVCSAAARWNERLRLESAAPALRWLERQPVPKITAAIGRRAAVKYRLYVPDNVGDRVAASWSRGHEASIADYRTEKDVWPTWLSGGDAAARFLWPIRDLDHEFDPYKDVIAASARSITHLGWGIDMVAANASIISEAEASQLPGERWYPAGEITGNPLRVPTSGTLDDLMNKHKAFLNRLGPNGFNPVPPLSVFQVVGYRRAADQPQRPCAAFSLLKPDASGNRSFDTLRQTREVAGMLRGAVARVAKVQGWPEAKINVFVHGKTSDGRHPASGQHSPDRFQYLPLPTINSKLRRVESVRRALIVAPPRCVQEVAWARRMLSGELLTTDHGDACALLTILPRSDWILKQYIGESMTWVTVTPVILPGHDSNKPTKTAKLLATAFEQAGFEKDLVARLEFEWRGVGFFPGVDLASRYLPPKNLDGLPRLHVHVKFPEPFRGPLAIGGGRFRGFGLFAVCPE